MTRRDSALVLVLVASLALVAALVGAPILQPAASRQPTAPPVVTSTDRPYREGVLGHPQSISPLTARTQADRDLVALLFSGLVRNGADGTLVPDLAAQWSVDEEGTTWTFQVYTHCGVESARIDGRWWHAQPPLYGDTDGGGPPAGWGNPYQEGTLTVE